ncbi:MAG: hypothetical protein QM736_20200 [Vicinamibacterales bacterium]
MKRMFAVALVATLAQASTAMAGESLLSAGTRHVQQIATTSEPTPSGSPTATVLPGKATPASVAYQGQGSTLSKSGMGKSKKALLYIGLAVGFAASVWTIDHHVLDVTPSSLGTRQD